MNQVTAPVISNSEVMPATRLIWLECPEIVETAKPGQFVMVRCGEDTLLPRPLSIHRVDDGRLALLVNVVGKGTGWLAERQPGDNLELFGPLGNGFTLLPEAKNILLVAGGIGIAPLCFLADEAIKQKRNVILLMGAQQGIQILSTELLPHPIKLVVVSTDDGSKGYKGPATISIPHEANQTDQVFSCGPTPMYRTMAQMPELKGKPVQVSLEITMGCGRGICYGCTIKTKNGLKKVCQDGPVFEMEDILWDEEGYL